MTRYSNPLRPEYVADPFVLSADGRWWAFGTGPGEASQSLVGLVSDDLVRWEVTGPVLSPGPLPDGATHAWAPEAVPTDDGRYALYYSAGRGDRGHRLRVALADVPGGPYTDVGVDLTPEEPFAIDPHCFVDSGGGRYLYYAVDRVDGSRVGTVVVVDRLLSLDRLAGDPRPVVTPSADWQVYEPGRSMYGSVYDWHTCEGPAVVRRGSAYWCLYSGGNWQTDSYGVSWASAPTPLGPWTEEPSDEARVLRSRPGVVHGPGHASVATDRTGQDWLVYHAWDPDGTARRMCIDPLTWTADGPVCDGPSAWDRAGPVV